MEKLRCSGQKQFCNRLLIFCILFLTSSFNLFSITPREIQNIIIKPEENVFFTNQELKYVLEIPDVKPEFVQTELQSMKEGVSIVSTRRMEYFSGDSLTGTRIEFWFLFKNPGIGEIPPLSVRINGRLYYLPFEKVQIYENPKTIAPLLSVTLNNELELSSNDLINKKNIKKYTVKVSEPIEIAIYIQYATQIKQFGFDIPKDSLFEEIKRYEIISSKLKLNDFSREKIPVAKFKWTPLKEGEFKLPLIGLIATAYSGRSLELGMPDCNIIVKELDQVIIQEDEPKDENIFAYALSTPIEDNIEKKVNVATLQDFKRIASLRSKERKSLISFSIRNERIEAERSIGINTKRNEANLPLWYIILFVFEFFLLLAILFLIFKKKNPSLICFCFAFCLCFMTIFFGIYVLEKHGVVIGGTISPIPENSALSSTAVTAGTCVLIKEETPDWYYIEYNENGGWIKKENVILVQ